MISKSVFSRLITLLKLILPYQLVIFLQRRKRKPNKTIITLRRWPEGIPEIVLWKGVPQKHSSYFDNLLLSKKGKVLSFMFGNEILHGVLLESQIEHDISYFLGRGKVTIPLCLPKGTEVYSDITITSASQKVELQILEKGK